jgi:MYXO-CTERM domain-containing protein
MLQLKRTVILICIAGLQLGLTKTVMAQTVYPLAVTAGTSWDIGSDNNNNLYLIWFTNGVIHFGQITNHLVTGEQIAASNASRDKYSIPRLSVRPDGQAMSIVYQSADRLTLKHAWRDSGGTWSTETIVGPLPVQIYYQAGAVGGDGTVHAVYSPKESYRIYYTYKKMGQSWVTPIDLGDLDGDGINNDNAEGNRMVVDSSGGIHWTWFVYRINSNFFYRYSAPGSTLDLSTTVKIDCPSSMGQGGIHVTHGGTVHLSPHYSRKVWHTYKPPGGVFSAHACVTESCVAIGGEGEPFNAIGAEESGKVYVSWAELVGGVNSVKMSILSNDTWTVTTVDSLAKVGGTNAVNMPAIAMTDSAAFLLWRHNDDQLYLGEYPISFLRVTAPNGGERTPMLSSQVISWTSSDATGNVRIELLKGEPVLGTIVDNLSITSSPYTWIAGHYLDATGIPQTAPMAGDYRIRISAVGNTYSDTSDGFFTLTDTDGGISTPDGGSDGGDAGLGGDDAGLKPTGKSGCGCDASGGAAPTGFGFLLIGLVLACLRRRRAAS